MYDPQQELADKLDAGKSVGKRGLGFTGTRHGEQGQPREIGTLYAGRQSAGDLSEQRNQVGAKREREEEEQTATGSLKLPKNNQVAQVASHYNNRKDMHRQLTGNSPVQHLKNFNNWVKSVLIKLYTPKNAVILDFCCGKAGDLMKWRQAEPDFVTFVDNAYNSILDGTGRYSGAGKGARSKGPMPFGAQFIVADCFQHDLLPHFVSSTPRFDLVSCQFALHYSFQTEDRANRAINNIVAHMKPGGHFVGTIPDANVLVRKLRAEPDGKMDFGNDVYRVRFDGTSKSFEQEKGYFGHKYNFFLKDSIDECDEFLIPWQKLWKICVKNGLELVEKRNFHKFFYRHCDNPELRDLVARMRVLNASEAGMSKDEWEGCFVYCAFVFKKKGQCDRNGEKQPPNYFGGRQASRVISEDEIVCFPGYGPDAQQSFLHSPEPSPRMGPGVNNQPVSPSVFQTF